ncbi:hypothetical protein AZE42_06210 [Rhizopogon vesiculosus]|uniref:Uncharacterized protein n=1 Tax=Rhizopogon vesiculosus TaxID=180088 RepID=A0A1J8Q9J3_9AGAM|nr:hypothetical protein AZE42_06210 [Rhizopogon vesiculosus]
MDTSMSKRAFLDDELWSPGDEFVCCPGVLSRFLGLSLYLLVRERCCGGNGMVRFQGESAFIRRRRWKRLSECYP